MRLGALFGPLADASKPRSIADQAKRFEACGYQSLWSPQAIGRGFMFSDPFITLATAAAVTTSVELGTAVVQVPLYHPGDLAHRVFSLMQTCGDRLVIGVGAGSTEADFIAYGRSYDDRFRNFTTSMIELRELLATGRIDGYGLSPWPAVVGDGPPIFLGSWGNGVERAARSFDGWIASAHYRTPEQVAEALQRYRAAGGGRAIVSTIQLGPKTDLGETRETLAGFAAAGFDDAVVMLLPGGPSPDDIRDLVD